MQLTSLHICFSRTRGGDPASDAPLGNRYPVFPAHAGVILVATTVDTIGVSFSRTRGGDPCVAKLQISVLVFFPHTRG